MKIKNIEVKNFRLLKNIIIELDEKTTIIVGKNNSGKTSLTELLNLFLNAENKKICADDFNLQCLNEFLNDFKIIPKIEMYITLEYEDSDEWENIIPFITTLEAKNEIKILFEYSPENSEKFLEEINQLKDSKNILELKEKIKENYRILKRPYREKQQICEPIKDIQIKNLFSFFNIEAQRSLDDGNSNQSNKFSQLMNNYYDKLKSNNSLEEQRKKLETQIKSANIDFDDCISEFFETFIESFMEFGFPGLEGNKIKLKSNLESSLLFKNIMKIYYENGNELLPEKYNGLGYSNLLYIIAKLLSFQSINQEKNKSMLCLIAIEEPEAHMHPQMQKVFIEKINKFLENRKFKCQIIITTHSAEIISNSELKNIRYFNRKICNTEVKDLMQFNEKAKEKENIEFLKKYIKLGTAHMFFADKIIMVEGLVERLLLPLFIKKIAPNNSEYISIIEVGGAHMKKFKELLKFLEVKTLVITDIDSDKGNKIETEKKKATREIIKGCEQETTNDTLISWKPQEKFIENLLKKSLEEKLDGNILITYQINQGKKGEIKCGRSFEEAFIITNPDYLIENKNKLESISNKILSFVDEDDKKFKNKILENSFEIYDFIDRNSKKSNFAFDLLMNEGWKTPTYIEEGLEWLLKKA